MTYAAIATGTSLPTWSVSSGRLSDAAGRDPPRHPLRAPRPAGRERWVASALLEAEQRFRRVRGYRDMRHLIAALDALVPPEVDVEQVA